MSKVLAAAYTDAGKWIIAFVVACVVSMMWISTAQAQSLPFDSQYDPPPTSPPASPPSGSPPGSVSPGTTASSESAPPVEGAVLSDSGDGPVVDLLPTTGGTPLAPILLGGAVLSAAAIVAVRKKRN